MASLYSYKESNVRRTWVLMTSFLFVVIGLGWIFSQIYGNSNILIFASLFSIVTSFISYWSSDKIALAFARAVPAEKKDYPEFYHVVENLTITAGLPMPRLYVTPERQINAFATGRDAEHAAVAVTAGALERLTKPELEGVLAHELSHVGNRDILVSTVAVVLAGIISLVADIFLRSLFWGGMRSRDNRDEGGQIFFFVGILLAILAPIGAMLIQLAVSRRRESLADASGILLTRYPEGLINALIKIKADNVPMASAKDSTAHLWLDNPFKGSGVGWWHRLFMTHPPIDERIAALRKLGV
jgi:heat shock protein HtpX